MVIETLERRMAVMEHELTQIKHQLATKKAQLEPAGWEKMFGIFADSEGFEEATRLGREYREAQRPDEDAETS